MDRLASEVRQHMTHQSHTCYTNAANKTAVSAIVQYSVVMQLMWVAILASALKQPYAGEKY